MATTYEVASIEPTSMIGPTNVVVQGQLVTIRTKPNNIIGQIRIPSQEFSEDTVRAAAEAEAALLEAVKAL